MGDLRGKAKERGGWSPMTDAGLSQLTWCKEEKGEEPVKLAKCFSRNMVETDIYMQIHELIEPGSISSSRH